MDNQLQVFTYRGNTVRTVLINGEAWLVAKDVCEVLGISNHRDACTLLDDDERDDVGITDAIGRKQVSIVINEAGLYKLTFKSRKPAAKEFTRWVTHEVLPSIHATGSYSVGREDYRPAPVEEDEPKKPALPQHSGIIKAAEKILHKAFKCKEEKDFQEVLALDEVFSQTFGVSALDMAGLRLVHSTRKVPKPIGKMHFGSALPDWSPFYWEVPSFAWEHDYPTLGDGSGL